MQGSEAREKISERNFWPNLSVWEAGPHGQIEFCIQGRPREVAYVDGDWNGVAMMSREKGPLSGVEMWSDASCSWGCGAIWATEWLQIAWNKLPNFREVPIAAKELLPSL